MCVCLRLDLCRDVAGVIVKKKRVTYNQVSELERFNLLAFV